MDNDGTVETINIQNSILYGAWRYIWTLESGRVHGGVYVSVHINVWSNVWVNVKNIVHVTISTDKQLADAYSVIQDL